MRAKHSSFFSAQNKTPVHKDAGQDDGRNAPPSRSQKKRDSTALQMLGEELAALSPAVWQKLPLPPDLAAALAELAIMKSHEARRRHLQYIGRLMRELDNPDELFEALANMRAEKRRKAGLEKDAAALRDALLDDQEEARTAAIAGAIEDYPALDPARLKHLVEGALAERLKKRPPKFSRELFRYLKERIFPD